MNIDIYGIKKKCPCCNGSGVQYNSKTGLKQLCPACQGRGEVRK